MKTIFIIGVGRSGTTLLQSILNAHSEIAFTPETHFLYQYLGLKNQGNIRNIDVIIDLLDKDEKLKRLNLNIGEIARECDPIKSQDFWPDLYKKLLLKYLANQSKKIIGDKDPMNSGLLPLIKLHFPEAYIIHIIRDPRDVVLSRLRSNWGKKFPLIAHLGDHKISLEKALKEGPELFGDNYQEVRYEDLISNTETEVRRLCEGINVPFEVEMLDFEKSSQELVSEDERQWKGNVFGKIKKNNTAKWINGLTNFQRQLSELTLGNLIEGLNYKKSGKGINPLLYLVIPLFFFIQLYFKQKYSRYK